MEPIQQGGERHRPGQFHPGDSAKGRGFIQVTCETQHETILPILQISNTTNSSMPPHPGDPGGGLLSLPAISHPGQPEPREMRIQASMSGAKAQG